MLLHDPAAAGTGRSPGVVLLADNLTVLAMTPEAQHLLSLIADYRAAKVPLPVAVHAAAL